MHHQRERRHHGKQHTQRPGVGVNRILAGAPPAVGQRVGQLHGFHAVHAQDGFDHEQAQDQPERAADALQQKQRLRHRPRDSAHPAADHQARRAHGDTGNPPGVRIGAQHLGQHAPRAQQHRVQLPAPHHGRECAGNSPAEAFRNIEGNRHQPEKEVQVSGCPLVQVVKPVHQQDHRQHFAAFHHQLRQRLHQEGRRVLHMAPDQHGHGFSV